MLNVDRIARLANEDSLVLLDELEFGDGPGGGRGAGCGDCRPFPQCARLECITTHLTSLKVYAANRAGVLNAAVGFDQATMSPTYELGWEFQERRWA